MADSVKKTPKKARTQNNIGYALINANRCDDAVSPLLLAIKADPWYIEPHYNIALCYIKKGHYGVHAIPRYDVQAHSNLGNIYNIKGIFDKAISNYKEALQ
ncbi:MAG: hypothetical protein HY265_08095, partial [Deltaproteobacteria bacterium]|nr:hypothetical protein [Deltaproteobacteria bacterium]